MCKNNDALSFILLPGLLLLKNRDRICADMNSINHVFHLKSMTYNF